MVNRKMLIGRLYVTETIMMPQNLLIPPIATIVLYSGTRTLNGGTIITDTIKLRINRFVLTLESG